MKPEVVLITQFEPSGDQPGEFTLFRKRFDLKPLAVPNPTGNLYASSDGSILGLIAGVGAVRTATTVTALGMDPRFDLSESLWLISGIAGGDPAQCPLGSPILTDWCVDGDLAWEIDGRELPDSWSTGILPLGAKEPYGKPADDSGVFGPRYEKVQLPADILEWARGKLDAVSWLSSPEAKAEGRLYPESPAAAADPSLKTGSTLSAVRFWHGKLMNDWAHRWVELFTGGAGTFHTSNMEDSGTLHAIRFLATLNRANSQRILLIRSVSNFTRPPEGLPAVSSLIDDESEAHFPGFTLALENGYRAAEVLIKSWIAGDRPPDLGA